MFGDVLVELGILNRKFAVTKGTAFDTLRDTLEMETEQPFEYDVPCFEEWKEKLEW